MRGFSKILSKNLLTILLFLQPAARSAQADDCLGARVVLQECPRKSVKTGTERPRETRTRENSYLALPAGNDGPAGSKPFRRERWILPGEEGGSPTDKPTIVLFFERKSEKISENVKDSSKFLSSERRKGANECKSCRSKDLEKCAHSRY